MVGTAVGVIVAVGGVPEMECVDVNVGNGVGSDANAVWVWPAT